MNRALVIHSLGPGVTVQDLGRPGHLNMGLSRGGAADRRAMAEGAALLGQDASLAALEMAGTGGSFSATTDLRIALTGAPMRASVDGTPLAWNASHVLAKGARLVVGGTRGGHYGYLHVGGGIDTPMVLGGRGAHLAAGLGAPLSPGDHLPLGPDAGTGTGLCLPHEDRFSGGAIRILPSLQTDVFPPDQVSRFTDTTFQRDVRGNRMGVRLTCDTDAFHSPTGLHILSEVIVPGDIQITGDGTPYVLLSECQTTGGYPRIGSVLPVDLPRVAQCPPGGTLRFTFVTLEEAVKIEAAARTAEADLRTKCRPLIRDPATIPDLLSYQLISGVTAGDEPEGTAT